MSPSFGFNPGNTPTPEAVMHCLLLREREITILNQELRIKNVELEAAQADLARAHEAVDIERQLHVATKVCLDYRQEQLEEKKAKILKLKNQLEDNKLKNSEDDLMKSDREQVEDLNSDKKRVAGAPHDVNTAATVEAAARKMVRTKNNKRRYARRKAIKAKIKEAQQKWSQQQPLKGAGQGQKRSLQEPLRVARQKWLLHQLREVSPSIPEWKICRIQMIKFLKPLTPRKPVNPRISAPVEPN